MARKFATLETLLMEDQSQNEVASWLMSLMRQTDEVVDCIWSQVFEVFELLCRLAWTLLVVLLVTTKYFTRTPDVGPLLGLLCFGPIQFPWLFIRPQGGGQRLAGLSLIHI